MVQQYSLLYPIVSLFSFICKFTIVISYNMNIKLVLKGILLYGTLTLLGLIICTIDGKLCLILLLPFILGVIACLKLITDRDLDKLIPGLKDNMEDKQ